MSYHAIKPNANSNNSMTLSDKSKTRLPRIAHGKPHQYDEESSGHLEEQNPVHTDTDYPEKLAKISGLQTVSALFHRDPHRVIRLYYDEKMKKSVGSFCAQMAKLQRPYRLVDDNELQKISGTVLHGGVVAAAVPRVVPDFDVEDAKAWAQAGQSLVILDGVGNPHNLGAIARTMAYFGLKYLLISDHPAQAGLSDAAHRVAEGGLEHLEVFRVVGCGKLCKRLREYYRVVGTSLSRQAVELEKLPYDPRPLALLLGNEEYGLPPETLSACEAALIIPGTGKVQSLNVSATAAILIHQMAAKQTIADPGKQQTKPSDKRGHVNRPRSKYSSDRPNRA